LLELARGGAAVVFAEKLQDDVPGFGHLEDRRKSLQNLLASPELILKGEGKLRKANLGRGNIFVGDPEAALQAAGLRRETLTDHEGLLFVRRADSEAHCYYLLNKSKSAFSGWLPLAVNDRSAALLDPMTSRAGLAASRIRNDQLEVFLQLQPGEAVFVLTSQKPAGKTPPWTYVQRTGAAVELTGNWKVEFLQGGPELPPAFTTSRLASWTELGGESAQRFAGTARYTLTFDAPAAGEEFLLTLGRVAQSAQVSLNGRTLGTVFMPPFQVRLPGLKPRGNVLEIEVTSVAANRIRDLDRRGVKWKNFHEINFVGLSYQPFDASQWPLHDAGLLGPVALQPLRSFTAPE
jgi:hypothetical protein